MKLTKNTVGLWLGPLLFVWIQFFLELPGLTPQATAVLACAAWMAVWWITEAISIAATALLPIVLFPLTGGLSLSATTANYGHQYIFLFLGGFILAIAIEKWQLHRRIALSIIALVGTNVRFIILGFMLATGFLSMWISNTAAAVMLLPVGMAIVMQLRDNPATIENENLKFGKALMLAIAYSASIGGMATLIGTPPNLVMAGVIQETYGVEITFFQWFLLAFPISVTMLLMCWWYLTKVAFKFEQQTFPGGKAEVQRQLASLGKMSTAEKRVLTVFVLMALAWISRSFVLVQLFPGIDDTIIAIVGALVLFILPAERGKPLVNWEDTQQLPWGIIILFGGGIALATGFENSGLAAWIGSHLTALHSVPFWLLLLLLVASVNFLTEITSNLATTAMILPVLVSIAASMQVHPFYLVMGATLAASCAFMLPVATPPNAVVFGSGYLKIEEMVKNGFWMNVISILIVAAAVYFLLPLVWDLQLAD